MPIKTLIFIPTYNELENARRMCEEIHELALDADVLFVDDASPDGTGDMLESLKPRFPRLIIQHRARKLGIGSAHFEAIQWAYDQDYQRLVTIDCDFTHSPTDIPAMIAAADEADASVGSRWILRKSLPGWNLYRRCITNFGHLLTSVLLGLPQDATGAFRAYRLDRIPRATFDLIRSKGYAFFFESLFILNKNGYTIRQVPIILPARTYGSSKMSTAAAWESARYIFVLFFANIRRPEQFLLNKRVQNIDSTLIDPQGWDRYWSAKQDKTGALYEMIAGACRRVVIKPNLSRVLKRVFPEGASLLHAGCGSGQVDTELQRTMRITALDISPEALSLYQRNNPAVEAIKHGDIMDLPFEINSFDGIYNLGVMEHFTHEQIARILSEFHRVLKPKGKVVIFWPHTKATSVFVLNAAHFLLNRIMKKEKTMHPPEISLCHGRSEVRALLSKANLTLIDYQFGPQDLFIQAAVVAEKS